MHPYYQSENVTIYHKSCLPVMLLMEPNSIDTIITDPPYGLEFMGKSWDHGVPGVPFWKAALKVAKPGAMLMAFGGTRTHHRLMCAIEDAGWVIRDVVMWVYGCLSEDTEILTADGWRHYSDIACGSTVMCYNVDEDKLQWETVQEIFTYAYSDTAYNIKSDSTDQLVSRSHRCLVERNGAYVYETAERLASQETVPMLEYLPGMQQDILARSGVEKESESVHLQSSMQWQAARGGVEETCLQRSCCVEFGKRSCACRENDWRHESVLEGRCDVLAQARQLPTNQVCAMPGGVCGNGAEGRVCDGTQIGSRATSWSVSQEVGGSTPHRPQPDEQQIVQPDVVCKQQPAQEIRGAWRTRPTLATVTSVHYEGVVWCVRVPTGAFVARRNGQIFVTGNSGFSKGLNISKAIDKMAGAERKVVGRYQPPEMDKPWNLQNASDKRDVDVFASSRNNLDITAPATDAAKLWDGWNTTLKPAWEPIVLAMKPLDGTFANNALKWGVAGLWIDGCRVPTEDNLNGGAYANDGADRYDGYENWRFKRKGDAGEYQQPEGRWPANLILDQDAAAMLDEQAGESDSSIGGSHSGRKGTRDEVGEFGYDHVEISRPQDKGGRSRFFYCAKVSRSERTCNGNVENKHPTVKPIALLRYLCRLTRTPIGGTILDPFMGSGSTLLAGLAEGRKVIGVDNDEESCEITVNRIIAQGDL